MIVVRAADQAANVHCPMSQDSLLYTAQRCPFVATCAVSGHTQINQKHSVWCAEKHLQTQNQTKKTSHTDGHKESGPDNNCAATGSQQAVAMNSYLS